MADDRPVEDVVGQLATVTRKLKDLRETVLARLASRPTGDIEPTIRSTAKVGTLILNGQVVSRATYPALWQWAQDQSLVISGLFTVGDGSTTFGLPDFRGRTIVGVGTLGSDTYTLGQTFGEARHALSNAEGPTHNHGGTNNTGLHNPHPTTQVTVQSGSGQSGVWTGNQSLGAHQHDIPDTGDGAAHENRQPSIAINWLVYT